MNFVLRVLVVLVALVLLGRVTPAQTKSHHYRLRYDLSLKPEEDLAEVALTLSEGAENIWTLRLHIDPHRHSGFEADGQLEVDGQYVTWSPPDKGGRLSFHVPVSHCRSQGRFDARMTDDWAIFRGDDLFPPAWTEFRDGAEADASLHVHLPQGWSFVTAYPEIKKNVYQIEHAQRSFDRPTGWMAAGRLGVRREKIAGVRVIVAGPMNQGVRRLDILAMLNWNLPRFRHIIPDMPKRLLIVSAGDPMWRGGLSGPNSLFLHADLPLVSENATSTLVHELMHVANRLKAEPGADWIVEGIAEYYSLKIMWRSGTITDHRYQKAFKKLEKWARQADRLDVDRSSGPVTARAVGVLRKLDREIHAKTRREKSLDDVVERLTILQQKVSLQRLRQAVVKVMGEPPDALTDKQLGFPANDR
ncbi:MAG: hypothetical protein IH831_10465 [Planctomycetes bacterium]|nr:hypothetical protein [Planctomycetota bacterium]